MLFIANLNLLIFCHFRCRRCRRFLSTLVTEKKKPRVKNCRRTEIREDITCDQAIFSPDKILIKNKIYISPDRRLGRMRPALQCVLEDRYLKRIFQTKRCLNEENLFFNSYLITCRPQH